MCIAREASKPLPSHHGFPQLKKSLKSVTRKAVINRGDSSETVSTASSHTSNTFNQQDEDIKMAIADDTAVRHKKNQAPASSLVSMILEHRFSDRCATPPPSRYDDLLEPPSSPHAVKELLEVNFDAVADAHLFLPFL